MARGRVRQEMRFFVGDINQQSWVCNGKTSTNGSNITWDDMGSWSSTETAPAWEDREFSREISRSSWWKQQPYPRSWASEMREQVLGVYMDDALCRGSLLIAYGAEAMFGDWWNRIFLAITIPTLDLWCTTLQVVILPSLPAIPRVARITCGG